MKVSCNIIRDLLPLYAEDMVSEDSKQMVDEHLCECDPCTKQLAIMKKVQTLPVDVDTGALKRVGNTIRRRRILAVLTALLFVVTAIMGISLFLDAEVYLTAEESIRGVEQLEDGSICIYYNPIVSGTGSSGREEASGNWGMITWARMEDYLFPEPRIQAEAQRASELGLEPGKVSRHTYSTSVYGEEMTNYNYWYVNAKDGTAEMLLWQGDHPDPQRPLFDVNYHIAYYCILLAGLCVPFALAGWKFQSYWYGELSARLSILFACLCLSVIIVSGGQFMELWGEFTECFVDSFTLAVPMTLTALFARQLYKLNKLDKGD